MTSLIEYKNNDTIGNEELNELFANAWPNHEFRDFHPVLRRSLGYICARQGKQLVGFVNVAWDGGVHAFLLDTTVRSDLQHKGIGLELVQRAMLLAQKKGVGWLHVDYEARLSRFYEKCGFHKTEAGLIKL